MYQSAFHRRRRTSLSDREAIFITAVRVFEMVGVGRYIFARQFSLPEVGLGIAIGLPNQQARKEVESW